MRNSNLAAAYYELGVTQLQKKENDAACISFSRGAALVLPGPDSQPILKAHLSRWLAACQAAHHTEEAKQVESRLSSIK